MRFVVGSLVVGMMVGSLAGCHGSANAKDQTPPPRARASAQPDETMMAADLSEDDAAEPGGGNGRKEHRRDRRELLRGARGTYSGEPRDEDGRIDIDRLVAELEACRANTYNFLLKRGGESDWEDLQAFLPLARQRGIHVWVTVTCPSKKSKMSLPYGHDYYRWAEEIARLSLREPNLVAWGMDDFSYNAKFFTRRKLQEVLDTAQEINPRLAFVPTVYYKHAVREGYAQQYKGLFDAVLFPYRAESSGRGNLEDPSRVEDEVRAMRDLFGRRVPVILDVYASRHSAMGTSTPEYVEEVMRVGRARADGVMVFRHQEPGTDKWEIVSASFSE